MREGYCIVTGASSGIGLALASLLASKGRKVVATARDESRIPVIEGVRRERLDPGDPVSIAAFAERMRARGGTLALLVNNAGYGAMGPLAELGWEELMAQFAVNLAGPMRLAGSLLPLMAKGSVVVDIGSVSGDFPTPFAGAYCASKAALHAAEESLRLELKPFGVHVLSARPGGIRSAFGSKALESAYKPRPGSAYEPYTDGITARAMESQAKAASAEDFARRLVAALERGNPPRVLRFGPRSRLLPALRAILPKPMLERILARKYGLDV